MPAVPRASSAEEDIFVESIQSTKVWCHTGGGKGARGKGASCAELWCHNSREVDCLAARRPHEKQSGDYDVPNLHNGSWGSVTCHYLGACSAPKMSNIRGLGGNPDVPLHRVWEYRDMGV